MKTTKRIFNALAIMVIVPVLFVFVLAVQLTKASELCTNDGWKNLERCTAPPETFEVTNGEYFGVLTSGVIFSQTNVSNELGVKLQRFEMESAYWYLSDRGVIYAGTDAQALSIYFTRG